MFKNIFIFELIRATTREVTRLLKVSVVERGALNMINQKDLRPKDIGRLDERLIKLEDDQLMPLFSPYDKPGMEPPLTDPKPAWKEKFCTSLDGYVGVDTLIRPKTKEEEDEFVRKFLSGLEKSFSDGNNGALQPFLLSFEYLSLIHISEPTRLGMISYAVFCLKKKKKNKNKFICFIYHL